MHRGCGLKELTDHELGPSREQTSSVRRRDLGLVHGDNHRQDTDRPTSDKSTGNEHTDVDGGGLESTSDNGNDGTDLDSPLSTKLVGSPTGHDGTEEGTGSEQGDDSSNDRVARRIKVIVEVGVRS